MITRKAVLRIHRETESPMVVFIDSIQLDPLSWEVWQRGYSRKAHSDIIQNTTLPTGSTLIRIAGWMQCIFTRVEPNTNIDIIN
jgi:hypothetical protein